MDEPRARDHNRSTAERPANFDLTVLTRHPDRSMALDEAHARPPLAVAAPASIAHLVLLGGEGGASPREHLARLSGEPIDDRVRQQVVDLGRTRLKWEQHTEFVSYTAVCQGEPDQDPLAAIPAEWLEDLPGALLVGLRVQLFRDAQEAWRAVPANETIYGGRMSAGIEVWTTFRPDREGFVHVTMASGACGADQLGRRTQRLVELETYRLMALLGLPLARRLAPQVSRLESELAAVMRQMTEHEDTGSDEATLRRLTRLSAEAEALRSEARFRFSATGAYYDLVEERLEALKEEKVGEVQTLGGFIATRLRPAARTVDSLWQRQIQLSADLSRALSLLRTRTDFAVNRGNQDLLDSMNRRHRQQVLIAQAVEGLSVVAISYYALGLLAYAFKALQETGFLPVPVALATGIAVPLTVAGVWLALRGLRRRWERREV